MWIAVSMNKSVSVWKMPRCLDLCVCVCVCQLGGHRAGSVWWGRQPQKAPRGPPLGLCGPPTEALEVGPQEPSVAPSCSGHITLWKPTTLYISCLTWRLGLGAESILGWLTSLTLSTHLRDPEGWDCRQ